MESKKCRVCGEEKPLDEYYYQKKVNRYMARCKECVKDRDREYYLKNKDKEEITKRKKEYYKKNKKKIAEQGKEYRKDNKEKIKERRRNYYKDNKEKILEQSKEYQKRNEAKKKKYAKEFRKKNKDKIKEYAREYGKEYRKNNANKIKKRLSKYYIKNKKKISEYHRSYYLKNEVEIRKKHIEYNENNQEKISKQCKKYIKKKKLDFAFRLNINISQSIRKSLKSNGLSKSGKHWEDVVGYTSQELNDHLESLFLSGMTWDNYGKKGWEIDHIIPVSFFKYTSTDDVEFKYCWSLNNLQPLWQEDNLSKGNRLSLRKIAI